MRCLYICQFLVIHYKLCTVGHIDSKIYDLNYGVKTPGRRKNTIASHDNMLKEYFEHSDNCKPISTVATSVSDITTHDNSASEVNEIKEFEQQVKLNN